MSYAPSAIFFDGTTDFMLRGADLTGIADSKLIAISFWYRIDSGDGTSRFIIQNNLNRLTFRIEVTDRIVYGGKDVSNALIAVINTSFVNVSGTGYHHAVMSWNTATNTGLVYIDDVSFSGGTFTDLPVDLTGTDWSVGAQVSGTSKFSGVISDLWMTTEFIDLTVEANRRKFIDANGRAVFLGDAGELPTGTPSIIYLRGNEEDQGLNSGTGGDFVAQATQAPGETPGPFGPGTLPAGVASMLQLSRRGGRFHRFFRG